EDGCRDGVERHQRGEHEGPRDVGHRQRGTSLPWVVVTFAARSASLHTEVSWRRGRPPGPREVAVTRMVLALSVVLLGFGCGGESPTAPTPVATAALTDEVRLAMQEAIADEYRAETIYQGV